MWRVRCAAAWGATVLALVLAVPVRAAWAGATDADPLPELQRLAREGRADRALAQLDALIKAHPDDPRWLFEKGLLLTSQKRIGDAIAVYERLTQAHPTLPEPYNNLGVLYASTGELDKSRAAFESALQCQQAARVAYANLGHVNLRLAGAAYARALHIDSGPKTLALAQIERLANPPGAPADVARQPTPLAAAPTSSQVVASVAEAPAKAVVLPARPSAASAPPVAAASAAAPATTLPGRAVAASVPKRAVPAPTPTAPAPTVSTPPATKPPAPTADTALAREVQTAITAWAAAWSRKDIDAYIAAYVPGYKGSEASATGWQAARRVRILGKSRIVVGVSRVTVEIGKDNTATASFRQSYAADQLNVNSTKTLDFVKVNGRWLIRREVAGS